MIRNRALAITIRLEALLNRCAVRRGLDPERGASTVEWVIIAAVVFLLAITVGTKITSVVNEQLAKIK
jgi:Flp pilus assembly pilin Flp